MEEGPTQWVTVGVSSTFLDDAPLDGAKNSYVHSSFSSFFYLGRTCSFDEE